MTGVAASLPLILEAAIAAQMLLFAAVQAAGVGRAGALRAALAIATGSLGLAVAINLLAALGIWAGLNDLNLVLELACVTASYLYVARAHEGARPPGAADLRHLAPSVVVFAAWQSGLAANADLLTLAVVALYLAGCAAALARHWHRYRPPPVLAIAVLLTASLAVLVTLRVAIMSDVAMGVGLRQSPAYLALLLFLAMVSSAILFLGLRYPNVLGARTRYGAPGALSERELATLDERFRTMMREKRPFLDPEISLVDLAAQVSVTPRDLSQLASCHYHMTVPALLNQWRLDEVVRMLSDPANQQPVTTIMFEAGFGSKSSFQREFQKRFSMSPSEYRAKFIARA